MTWFQLLPGAPTDDEEIWAPYQEPVSFNLSGLKEQLQHLPNSDAQREAAKELMRKQRLRFESEQAKRVIADARIHPEHRGVMIGTVEETGETVVTSTRCIRTETGPSVDLTSSELSDAAIPDG